MMEFAQENQLEPINEEENEESAISWWKKWAIIDPKFSLPARSLFGIPPSSCKSERIVSAAGRILEEWRQT
jgi:hypothetical protein